MFIGGVQESIDQAGAALLHDPRGLGFLPILENFVISLVAHDILHLRSGTNGKATPQHSPQFRADRHVPIPPANKVGGRQAAAFRSNVPLSFQYEIRDDAMTAQFEIEGNDVEGCDAIVGQAAWLGLETAALAAPFSRAAERLALNQSKTYADLERRPCCVEENEMSYHIEINEYQRRLIMKALTSTDVNQFSQAPGSGDAFDNRGQRIRLPGTDVWYARPRRYRPGGLKLFSASKCDPARLRSNVSWWRPDCLAGHVRFEVRRETGKE